MAARFSKGWKIVLAVLVVGAAAAGTYLFLFRVDVEEVPEPVYRSQLTGVEVEQEESERPILGVMIENTPAARPQTGLDSAGIVFEVLTEGGITRTLALYQEDMPEVVGPIRSLRPYFVHTVLGFDVSVAHVGGSGEALQMVEDLGVKSLDQFRHSDPYYRTDDRQAPHNMYANTKDLRDLQSELEHEQSTFDEIPRSNDSPAQEPTATDITIDYSGPDYLVEFQYSSEDNSYTRYLAGEPHIDAATDRPVIVKNLIVITVPGSGADTAENGEALVFKDGNAREVSWRKSSADGRIEIVNEEGRQLPLNRGDSWFAVLPQDRTVSY